MIYGYKFSSPFGRCGLIPVPRCITMAATTAPLSQSPSRVFQSPICRRPQNPSYMLRSRIIMKNDRRVVWSGYFPETCGRQHECLGQLAKMKTSGKGDFNLPSWPSAEKYHCRVCAFEYQDDCWQGISKCRVLPAFVLTSIFYALGTVYSAEWRAWREILDPWFF